MLVERYLNDPKPVLWRGSFHVKDQETPRETVARCYPMLIAARKKSYETLAHWSVQVSELRATGDDAAGFGRRELFGERFGSRIPAI